MGAEDKEEGRTEGDVVVLAVVLVVVAAVDCMAVVVRQMHAADLGARDHLMSTKVLATPKDPLTGRSRQMKETPNERNFLTHERNFHARGVDSARARMWRHKANQKQKLLENSLNCLWLRQLTIGTFSQYP
jgi:hypothetical protein